MTALIITTLLLLATIATLIASRTMRDSQDKKDARVAFSVLLALTVGVGVASSFTHTKSNEISINHNFGTYQNTTGPGITFVGPFTQSTKFTTRLQTEDVKTGVTLKSDSEGVVGIPADVKVTVRYHIYGTEHAEDMWRKYREFEEVTKRLVVPEAKTSIREVYGKVTPAQAKSGETIRTYGDQISTNLQRVLADDGIKIDSINVTSVGFGDQVEDRLAAQQKAAADAQKRAVEAESRQKTAAVDAQTRLDVATKDAQTAAQQAKADGLRKGNVTRETLADRCLSIAEAKGIAMNCNFWMTNQYAPVPTR